MLTSPSLSRKHAAHILPPSHGAEQDALLIAARQLQNKYSLQSLSRTCRAIRAGVDQQAVAATVSLHSGPHHNRHQAACATSVLAPPPPPPPTITQGGDDPALSSSNGSQAARMEAHRDLLEILEAGEVPGSNECSQLLQGAGRPGQSSPYVLRIHSLVRAAAAAPCSPPNPSFAPPPLQSAAPGSAGRWCGVASAP